MCIVGACCCYPDVTATAPWREVVVVVVQMMQQAIGVMGVLGGCVTIRQKGRSVQREVREHPYMNAARRLTGRREGV